MAPYSTPIPGVPQYGQAALAAKTAYGNALARINGVVQRTMAPAGAQYSRSQTLPHLARVTIATAGDVLDVQAQANGSDATYSEGSVELEPIRII